MGKCLCGCGRKVDGATRNGKRRFVSGHNLRTMKRTPEHRAAISAALRYAWRTKRQRLPVGTRRISHDGYVLVKVLPGKGPWRAEHALVVERVRGFKLGRQSIVHHIDLDRANNDPSNLHVYRNRAQHNAAHRSQDAAFRACLAAGFVRFRNGAYEAVLPR